MRNGTVGLKTCVHQADLAKATLEQREYRPVISVALIDGDSRVLLIRSLRCPKEWTLIEGDLDAGDDFDAETHRVISDGIGIATDDLHSHDIGRVCDVDAASPKTVPKGFTKGTRFFGRVFDYDGPAKLEAATSTAVAYVWCPPFDLDRRLARSSPWRRRLILDILGR